MKIYMILAMVAILAVCYGCNAKKDAEMLQQQLDIATSCVYNAKRSRRYSMEYIKRWMLWQPNYHLLVRIPLGLTLIALYLMMLFGCSSSTAQINYNTHEYCPPLSCELHVKTEQDELQCLISYSKHYYACRGVNTYYSVYDR